MIASGTNTFINGCIDFKYEWNHEWSEVGQHNAAINFGGNLSKVFSGNEDTGKWMGNKFITGADVLAASHSVYDLRKLVFNVESKGAALANISKIYKSEYTLAGMKSADNIFKRSFYGKYV